MSITIDRPRGHAKPHLEKLEKYDLEKHTFGSFFEEIRGAQDLRREIRRAPSRTINDLTS